MAGQGLLEAGFKAAAPAAVGAGLLVSPEEAEAGFFNTAASLVRKSADVGTRDLSQERGSNRGKRKLATRVKLFAAEKKAIRAAIKGKKGVTEVAAFNVAREWKKRHPA